MSYEKQNFIPGDILRAVQLNMMEKGIYESVSVNEQELTEEQKARARANIGAAAIGDVSGGGSGGGGGDSGNAVLFTSQNLTDAQKAQARVNIGASSQSEVEKLGSRVDALENSDGGSVDAPYIIKATYMYNESVHSCDIDDDFDYDDMVAALKAGRHVFARLEDEYDELIYHDYRFIHYSEETGIATFEYRASAEEAYLLTIEPGGWPDVNAVKPTFVDYANDQALTDEQKAKARANIGAASESGSGGGVGESTTGNEYTLDEDNSGAAGDGAEVFNDYEDNIAYGEYSHAEGSGTTAWGNNSHAEGGGTIARGRNSHAEGTNTEAIGTASHAEGSGTQAGSLGSHAEGMSTEAEGSASHAEGRGTYAGAQAQHVQGKYNIKDTNNTYAHIVGNGTADDARSNAHTIDWDGNAWFAGKVYVGGTSMEDATPLGEGGGAGAYIITGMYWYGDDDEPFGAVSLSDDFSYAKMVAAIKEGRYVGARLVSDDTIYTEEFTLRALYEADGFAIFEQIMSPSHIRGFKLLENATVEIFNEKSNAPYIITGTYNSRDCRVTLDNFDWQSVVNTINYSHVSIQLEDGSHVWEYTFSDYNSAEQYMVFARSGETLGHELLIVSRDSEPFIKVGGSTAPFYTELVRDGDVVTVICRGLTVGQTYSLHLYTAARRRGRRQDPWRHPSNENTGDGFTGKGYFNLAGQHYACNEEYDVYPPVPDWMPNGGILQTEWEITASAETEYIEIPLGTWLLDMLKPVHGSFDAEVYALIGVYYATAPLLMQFRLTDGGTTGECKNTLCVGISRATFDRNNGLKRTVDGGIAGLYTSIR